MSVAKTGRRVEVGLEEVRRLGEQDADFRRSIVTSTETLNTIVDASVRELDKLRQTADDNRLKIIASALNYEHCRQVVQAYLTGGAAPTMCIPARTARLTIMS